MNTRMRKTQMLEYMDTLNTAVIGNVCQRIDVKSASVEKRLYFSPGKAEAVLVTITSDTIKAEKTVNGQIIASKWARNK